MSDQAGGQRGSVRYENVDQNYLEQRQLRKSAGWFLLWGLGVGAVISGDFFGWNFGLSGGGFVGLAVATFLMATMYLCMVYSIAELSTALPHAADVARIGAIAFERGEAVAPERLEPAYLRNNVALTLAEQGKRG